MSNGELYLLYEKWEKTTAFQVFQRHWDTQKYNLLKDSMSEKMHSPDKSANYDDKLGEFMERFPNTWSKYNSSNDLLSIYIDNYRLHERNDGKKKRKRDFFYYMSCENPKLVLYNPKVRVKYKHMSRNYHLRIEDVIYFHKKKWDWKAVFEYAIIKEDMIETHFQKIKWDFQSMSKNKSITKEIVIRYQDQPWNWKELSKHIEWDIVLSLPDKPWDYKMISRGKRRYWRDLASLQGDLERCIQCDITWDIIVNYPQIPWDYGELSDNPNITMENIMENMDKPWDFIRVAHNIHFKTRYMSILNGINMGKQSRLWTMNLHFVEKSLIYHANTTLEDWERDLFSDTERDYKCYFMMLSYNPNLTWDFFIQHNYFWDYDFILTSGLFRERMIFIMKNIERRNIYLEELKTKVPYQV